MQFTFTELQVLAGLAEGLTVVDIADRLSLGHSSISRALHVAQQRAGIQIVERRGRRLRLTIAGQDLALRARSAVQEVDEVNRLAEAQRAGTTGVVRILASATVADYVLPPVIARFLRSSPRVHVVVRTAVTEHAQLETYDLRIGPPGGVQSGWRAEPLYTDRLVFFVAPSSPLASRSALAWEDVRNHTLVGHYLEPYWPQYWAGLSDPPVLPDHVVDVSTPEAVKRIVELTDAVGVAVHSAIAAELESHHFVALPPFGQFIELPYILIARSGGLLPSVEQFRSQLVRHVADSRRPDA